MKLTRVEVKNYRSLFAEKGSPVTSIDLAEGMNAFVGPNNIGKSNLLRAVALALDPDYPFDRDKDMPSALMFAFPRVTLEFACEGKTSSERTLLRRAGEYERSILKPPKKTYADDGILRFTVSFPGNDRFGATRQEIVGIRGAGARQGDVAKLERAVAQFRRTLRFVMIQSGQSLEEVLAGKFREILRSVIQEHLTQQYADAEGQRLAFIEGLQTGLLAPLRDRVSDIVTSLFPEIGSVVLEPSVADIDTALSNVGVTLEDSVATPLQDKGTGVRGGVMVAMLRYLADQSRRSMVFAVEEPEAFLHPAAQEALRDDLESLAERRDVTLLVSTHSPHVVSRDAKARVFAMSKDGAGRTRIIHSAKGDEPLAGLLGGLFRDSVLSELLDATATAPSDARALVLVEGTTDADYLSLAARISKQPDLLQGLWIIPAGGASKLVIEAVVARSRFDLPLLALLDSDEMGRTARKTMTDKLAFQGPEVLSYSALFNGAPSDIEAEDLFPQVLLKAFIKAEGEDTVLSDKHRIGQTGQWHFGFTSVGKDLIVPFIEKHAKAGDFARWIELLAQIRERVGLND
ncbi:MAG: AAA family ATPase [Actinomycetota bacterium]